MHPGLRIVGLILLGTALTLGRAYVVLLAVALVCALYVATSTTHFAPAWKMLVRMRWLFISIVVFYFFFTPGHPVAGVDSSWAPTHEGLTLGALRLAALVTLVLAVNLLLQTTPRDALLAGLLWCLRPLRVFGLPHDRLVVRLTLVLHAVPHVQELYGSAAPVEAGLRARVATFGARMAELFERVIVQAEREPDEVIVINDAGPPRGMHWLYLVGLCAVLIAAWILERGLF